MSANWAIESILNVDVPEFNPLASELVEPQPGSSSERQDESNEDDFNEENHWTISLRCAICLEYLNLPKVLPCGHSFCKSCIQEMIDHSRIRNLNVHPLQQRIYCPACRQKCFINKFYRFSPNNHAITSAIDGWNQYKRHHKKNKMKQKTWENFGTQTDAPEENEVTSVGVGTVIFDYQNAETQTTREVIPVEERGIHVKSRNIDIPFNSVTSNMLLAGGQSSLHVLSDLDRIVLREHAIHSGIKEDNADDDIKENLEIILKAASGVYGLYKSTIKPDPPPPKVVKLRESAAQTDNDNDRKNESLFTVKVVTWFFLVSIIILFECWLLPVNAFPCTARQLTYYAAGLIYALTLPTACEFCCERVADNWHRFLPLLKAVFIRMGDCANKKRKTSK